MHRGSGQTLYDGLLPLSCFHWEWKEGTDLADIGKGATTYCNSSSLLLVHCCKKHFTAFFFKYIVIFKGWIFFFCSWASIKRPIIWYHSLQLCKITVSSSWSLYFLLRSRRATHGLQLSTLLLSMTAKQLAALIAPWKVTNFLADKSWMLITTETRSCIYIYKIYLFTVAVMS